MPERIQLKRTKGWRMPPNTVKVDRTTRFGNPYLPGDHFGAKRAVWLFRLWLNIPPHFGIRPQECHWDQERRDRLLLSLELLRGKNLACWCALDAPCHADVLLEMSNV